MAKAFCIVKSMAEELKAAAKRGEIVMADLYEMTSEERRSLFEKYTKDATIAKNINAGFEESMVSSQKNALLNWVKSTFTGKEKKSKQYADIVDQINQLDELGMINPHVKSSFLEDLVATKLGANVTQEEVAEISTRAKKLEELMARDDINTEFGFPKLEYWQARKEMQDYLDSLVPSKQIKILMSTIGRGTMLTSIKSPLVNIIGNTVSGMFTMLEKRLASGQFTGVSGQLAKNYVSTAVDIYKKTGYDVTRMYALGESFNTLGEQKTHSQGKGAIRKIGRIYEDLVFKNMLGLPDVVASAIQKADSINLLSTELAKREGLKGDALKTRADELFKKAAAIDVDQNDTTAQLVSSQATMDAMVSTFTNDSNFAQGALNIRKVFNSVTGDIGVGEFLVPFAKTPANVVNFTLDVMGISAIRSTFNLPEAINQLKQGNREPMRAVARGYVRAGMGITLAILLAGSFDDDEFMGAYPTTEKERQLMELENATPNSIKIAGKWISLDFFGPLAAPMMGMLYAKKYADKPEEAVLKYAQAGLQQGLRLPGIDTLYQTISDAQKFTPGDNATFEENVFGLVNSVGDQLAARLIPAIISDVARAIDPLERDVNSKDPIAKLKAKIPGVRQSLPANENIFGKEVKAEPALSRLLFGSRVKTEVDNSVINELQRLKEAGFLPSLTDVEKTSDRVKSYKLQVSAEKYDTVMDSYQSKLEQSYIKAINSSQYKRLSDEEKKANLEKLKTDILDDTLKRGGYKKPKKK